MYVCMHDACMNAYMYVCMCVCVCMHEIQIRIHTSAIYRLQLRETGLASTGSPNECLLKTIRFSFRLQLLIDTSTNSLTLQLGEQGLASNRSPTVCILNTIWFSLAFQLLIDTPSNSLTRLREPGLVSNGSPTYAFRKPYCSH